MRINGDIGVAAGLYSHYDATVEAPPEPRPIGATTGRRPRPEAMVAAAAVAAEAVRLMGRAIDTYNQQIDDLNAQWRAAKARTLDAKLELLSRLEHAYGDARRELDKATATATRRLARH